METMSLHKLRIPEKVALVYALGYQTDRTHIFKNGELLKDKYTSQPVRFDNMAILPGSTIIIDNNPLSIAHYIQEFGNPFETQS